MSIESCRRAYRISKISNTWRRIFSDDWTRAHIAEAILQMADASKWDTEVTSLDTDYIGEPDLKVMVLVTDHGGPYLSNIIATMSESDQAWISEQPGVAEAIGILAQIAAKST